MTTTQKYLIISSCLVDLFLLRILSIGLQLGSLLPDARISLFGPQLSQLNICLLLALRQVTALDLREAMSQTCTCGHSERTLDLRDELGRAVSRTLNVRFGGVQFLVLAGFTWEEDEAGLVGL